MVLRCNTPAETKLIHSVDEEFRLDFCQCGELKVAANETPGTGSSADCFQSSLPPIRDRRRNPMAPARLFLSLRRRSSQPRRLHDSEQLDQPARQAALRLR